MLAHICDFSTPTSKKGSRDRRIAQRFHISYSETSGEETMNKRDPALKQKGKN